MSTTTVTSKQFSLSIRDVLKGLLMAVLTPVVLIISQSVNAGSLVFNWHSIAIAALSGGLAYLVKNFFTAPQVVMTDVPPQTVQQIKDGTADVKVMSK